MIEPMTATPSAPPTWRVTSLIAEPTPALASGTALMTESVAGAIAAPIDSARPNVTSASSDRRHVRRPREAGAEHRRHAEQAARDDAPPAEAVASRLDAPEPITRPSASGSMAAPASSALKPCANWRYWVKAKTEPIIAKNTSATPDGRDREPRIAEESERQHRGRRPSAPTGRTRGPAAPRRRSSRAPADRSSRAGSLR